MMVGSFLACLMFTVSQQMCLPSVLFTAMLFVQNCVFLFLIFYQILKSPPDTRLKITVRKFLLRCKFLASTFSPLEIPGI